MHGDEISTLVTNITDVSDQSKQMSRIQLIGVLQNTNVPIGAVHESIVNAE